MGADVDIAVIGAGAVGLAIARALAVGGREVLVLERHGRVGTEVSSRSSEVIHAGLYYPPGSLKARLCVAGKVLLYRFAAETGVAAPRTGKLVVATREAEIDTLKVIAARAERNGVGDLRVLTGAEARGLEPEIACAAALLSPSTGVIDSQAYLTALEGHVLAAGGSIVLNAAAEDLRRTSGGDFEIMTGSAEGSHRLTARHLVVAAGLGASALGRALGGGGGYRVPATYPAKGHYFTLAGRAPFRHLIYPVPQDAWLGVHLTLDVAGQARFGPDLAWLDDIDYAFEDEGGERLRTFEREVRRYWPGLPEGALQQGYTGIRPKIYREGEPAPDFAIHGPAEHGIDRLVALYGIESPGLTSSLAIGSYVAGLIDAGRLGSATP